MTPSLTIVRERDNHPFLSIVFPKEIVRLSLFVREERQQHGKKGWKRRKIPLRGSSYLSLSAFYWRGRIRRLSNSVPAVNCTSSSFLSVFDTPFPSFSPVFVFICFNDSFKFSFCRPLDRGKQMSSIAYPIHLLSRCFMNREDKDRVYRSRLVSKNL